MLVLLKENKYLYMCKFENCRFSNLHIAEKVVLPFLLKVACRNIYYIERKLETMDNPNTQGRKWLLTIQKPTSCGLTTDYVNSILQSLLSLDYYCLCRELATTGTEHMHIFMFSSSPIRFSTIKRKFPVAHIDKAYGSCSENRTYLRKEGKWASTTKAETSIAGSFFEWGILPKEGKEKSPMKAKLIEDIQSGMTTAQIIMANPNYSFHTNDINTLRETLLSEKYSSMNRNVKVSYIYGKTGAGKSRYVFEHHSYFDVARITNYGSMLNPTKFDGYHGQDVLVFDEFHSQIPLPDMLNILDIYPLQLPARYSDRVACYTHVYIISNLPLSAQYESYQKDDAETWNAFLRRISSIKEIKNNGISSVIIEHDKKEYVL